MSDAEEFAYSKYPKEKEGVLYDLARNSIIEGYCQAEEDLELTNEDVYDIWRIYNEVCSEGKILGFDETSQEVLKRFRIRRGGLT